VGAAPGRQRIFASAWPLTAWRDLDVAANSEQPCDLELKGGVSVVGTIRYADGTPACAGLYSTPERTPGSGTYCGCAAREDGTFYLYYQPCRRFWVIAQCRGQVLAEREFPDPQSGVVHCDFVLDRLLPIHGHVLDEQGHALESWQVRIEGSDAKAHGTTDASGAFRTGFASGQAVRVAVIPEDGDWSAPALVKEDEHADGRAIELRVPMASLPSGAVCGRLVGPDGNGLPAVSLILHRPKDTWQRFGTIATDHAGRFTFDHLSAGGLAIALVEWGDPGRQLSSFALAAGQRLDLGDLVIQPPAVLEVMVTRPDGSPWQGALPYVVCFDAKGGQVNAPERPDASGIRVELPAGAYRVEIRGDDLIASPQQVDVEAGSVRTLRFAVGIGRSRELVFNGDGHCHPEYRTALHVSVRKADGSLLLQEEVEALMPDLRGFRYWYLDRVFAFGRYQVEANSDTGQRYSGRFEVRESLEDPTRVEVPLVGQ
jgi:hypothetical protein